MRKYSSQHGFPSFSSSAATAILDGIARGDQIGGPTALARHVSESVNACGGLDVPDLTQRYLHWHQTDAFDTGPTFHLVFSRVADGVNSADAAKQVDLLLGGDTAGCGPAHRSGPLAACFDIPTSDLAMVAKREARITHYHPDAGSASAVVVLLCRYLLEGGGWEEAKARIAKDVTVADAWRAIEGADLNPGGYAFDVIHSALHFLDGEDALDKALDFAGCRNYCSVIVGLLEGAMTYQPSR
jgi:ADP-ribosylglycohydrolase